MIEPHIIGVLFLVGVLAGWIDAIAGGGGLITIPSLLWAGLPPTAALATNKAQSVFGSGTAAIHFTRSGYLAGSDMRLPIIFTFIGAITGAFVVSKLQSDVLLRIIPFLLIAFALYFLLSPHVADIDRKKRMGLNAFAMTAGIAIGFYDGFFGPGTGSFFTLAIITLLGFGLTRATAHAKILNATSNAAALLYFAYYHHVIWQIGLLMGLGQVIGSTIGSKMAIKRGATFIRPLLVIVTLAMAIRLLLGGSN